MAIYVVKEGDTVDAIGAAAGIPVETLLRDNQIEYPYRLAVGQALYMEINTPIPIKHHCFPLDMLIHLSAPGF